jgi:hypothetical protein
MCFLMLSRLLGEVAAFISIGEPSDPPTGRRIETAQPKRYSLGNDQGNDPRDRSPGSRKKVKVNRRGTKTVVSESYQPYPGLRFNCF